MSVVEKAASLEDAAIAHYQLVAPIMERLFGGIPLVWLAPSRDPSQPPTFHTKYFGHYSRLSDEHLQHLVQIGAMEFHSWFPIVEDPARARFARFLLERQWTTPPPEEKVRQGALIFKQVLDAKGHSGIPVLDGVGGVSIFVPLANGPSYADVRTWCHAIAREVIGAHPDLFSEAPNVCADGRVHIHVSSNAEWRWSIIPYSMRANTRRIATPVTWDEIETFDMLGAALNDFPARLKAVGDVFGAMLQCPLPIAVRQPAGGHRGAWHGHGIMATAVRQILSDGIARSAPEIWQIAQERKLYVASTEPELVNDIDIYLERELANGRKPAFIRTADHKFRINEPPDPWPDAAAQSQHAPVDADALIARLQHTGLDGGRPEDFEVAVCDALAALGFLTTHVGGHAAPDGYADAPLGTMGYRVMLECKSGSTVRKGPDIYEAAKYKDDHHAQYCILIGGGSGTWQQEAMSEIKTHGVALWCADDLAYALQTRLTPLELQPAFAPGAIAQDVIPDILWERDHGRRKRVQIIADIIRAAGWITQCAAAQGGSPADAPQLTEDAAMLLVDQELAAQGARVNCTREEVRLAFEWLTNPLNVAAAWNADKTAIVILKGEEQG